MGKRMMAGVGVATLIVVGGWYWRSKMPVPAYEIVRVIDGDTFETKEKQRIRLANLDAPELDLCGGAEAKKELEKLVLGQPVYLKILYRDKYMRFLSLVYTPEGFVNEKMAGTGLSVYRLKFEKSPETEKIERAYKKAVKEKIGLYSAKCTQTVNSAKPKCNIKGNVREGNDAKTFIPPGCTSYSSTLVQLYLGDRWFCTEAEAVKAGFRKVKGCN